MTDKGDRTRIPDRDRKKGRDDEEWRGHRAGEQFQPEHAADQGADEVMPDEKEADDEGRTNVDVHEPRPEDIETNRRQSIPPRRRDVEE